MKNGKASQVQPVFGSQKLRALSCCLCFGDAVCARQTGPIGPRNRARGEFRCVSNAPKRQPYCIHGEKCARQGWPRRHSARDRARPPPTESARCLGVFFFFVFRFDVQSSVSRHKKPRRERAESVPSEGRRETESENTTTKPKPNPTREKKKEAAIKAAPARHQPRPRAARGP